MVVRNFNKCTNEVKCNLFNSFCTTSYGLPLVMKARISDIKRLKVCYNNSVRKLFGVSRQESVSTACVHLGLPSFDVMRRKGVVSLLQRLKSSNNSIVKSLINFQYFQTTFMFFKWKTIAYTWYCRELSFIFFIWFVFLVFSTLVLSLCIKCYSVFYFIRNKGYY